MIAPKELRMQNLVYVTETDQIVPITAINLDIGVIVNRSLRMLAFTEIEPIELTEEWLLKFGFEIGDDGSSNLLHSYKEAFYGDNPVTKDYLLILKNTGGAWFYRNGYFKINTVHQLQNLYYSLCGEELKIIEI